MKIRIKDGLPFISATLVHHSQRVTLKDVLLDTGSAGTIFPTDKVAGIGLIYEPQDMVHRIRGVGGSEFVFTKHVDELRIGALKVEKFEVEIGPMDYGFDMDGIIGVDFLTQVRAVIDLARMKLRPARK